MDRSSSHRQLYVPPDLHSIHRGTVSRIESYGAFVRLPPPHDRVAGLVHISQLASFRVNDVNDAVSMGDEVYVKVIGVDEEVVVDGGGTDNGGGRKRMRHKVRLSMKYCDQAVGTDLDPDHSKAQSDLDRSRGGGGGGGEGNDDGGNGRGGMASELERRLTARVGMGIALDPMTSHSGGGGKSSGLVLKGQQQQQQVMYNGYALVDDDEGEPAAPAPAHDLARAGGFSAASEQRRPPTAPVGRGRGSTLPAWMTQQNGPAEGPTGLRPGKEKSRSRSRSRSSSGDDKRRRRRGSKGKRDRRKGKEKKRHKKERSRRREKRLGYERGRSYSRSRSRSESRERSGRHRRRRKDDEEGHHHLRSRRRSRGSDSSSQFRSRERRDRGRSRSSSLSDASGGKREARFSSVEEARAVIARLEGKHQNTDCAG